MNNLVKFGVSAMVVGLVAVVVGKFGDVANTDIEALDMDLDELEDVEFEEVYDTDFTEEDEA